MSSTYIVRMGLLPYYKVGSTKWNVESRVAALQDRVNLVDRLVWWLLRRMHRS